MTKALGKLEHTPSTPKIPNIILRLLRLPLLFKVLIANSIIVGLGAFVGTWLTAYVTVGEGHSIVELALFLTLAGLLLSGIVNYAVLRCFSSTDRTSANRISS